MKKMLSQIILSFLLGILAGIITGLLPGIHINLISTIIVFLSLSLTPLFPLESLIVFIVSMSIVHTFIDFIPSILLGAPDEDSALSVLPGHQLLNEGKAYFAIIYTAYGSISAIFLVLLLTPFFLLVLQFIYPYVQNIMFFILITASFFLIITEKNNKLYAIFIFFLTGFLGIASLNLSINQPLLPLLTGLFGSSSLILSIAKKSSFPQQEIPKLKEIKIKFSELKNSLSASLIASPICSFLPGLGSSQAAAISSSVIGETDKKQFLILLGSINILVMGLSFVTLYTINKSRTGSAAAISQLTSLSSSHLIIILSTILISGLISFFLTIFLSKVLIRVMARINYSLLSLLTLIFVSILVIVISGPLGFLVFLASTFTGLTAISLNIKRTHMMGCLMIPTILYYLAL